MCCLEWTEYSKKDYDDLDGSQRIFVDKALDRIRQQGMFAGKPLWGKLAACRKLKHKKLGLRVIFRESGKSVEIIEIVAIGKRDKFTVYSSAEKRI
jgi:mRNA interferase RelE/StbE